MLSKIYKIYIYLRAAARAANPGQECEEAERGPRPRFCFLVAAESNGSCKGIGLLRVGDTAQLSQTKIRRSPPSTAAATTRVACLTLLSDASKTDTPKKPGPLLHFRSFRRASCLHLAFLKRASLQQNTT